MSFNSVGLMDDEMTFGGNIHPAKAIRGKKFKRFDARLLTGNTKITEETWCKAFCKAEGRTNADMAVIIENLISEEFSQQAVGWRFNTIKRFYLWVCLAFLKENHYYGAYSRANSPYRKATRAVVNWIKFLQAKANHPVCTICKDTGLKANYDWDYCTCKRGKQRKQSIMN